MTSCADPSSLGTRPSLWRHRDLRRYLTGQAAGVTGSSISAMVIPVPAVLELDATAAEVARLTFMGQLPPALLALHAGALAGPREVDALFAAAAEEYDRYRPGVPAEVAELLADAVRDLPGPTLLDVGVLGDCPEPGRPFPEDLADSAWSDMTEHRVPSTPPRTPEVVLGCLRSTPCAGADLFVAPHAAFEDETRALLDELAAGGSPVEETVFTVLLARRPGGAR